MSKPLDDVTAMRNRRAFLDMIARSEGTYGIGDNGYDVMVGSTKLNPVLFTSYKDHPRRVVHLRAGLSSTAAGRYQILARYYDAYKQLLKLKDFSPASQDAIATRMIREQLALDDVREGRVVAAVEKCKNIWASLPGAGYNQYENSVELCKAWFEMSGGVIRE